MSKLRCHTIYLLIIAALTIVLGFCLSKPKEVSGDTKKYFDTIIITEYDTIKITEFIEIEKLVVDTLYIPSEGKDSVPIPISEYHFFEKSQYDIYARGYNVSLRNVIVFPKVETMCITNTIEREIIISHWDVYFGANLSRLNNEWLPSITATVKTPKRWLISANLGIYDNKPIYGVGVQYRLTNNK